MRRDADTPPPAGHAECESAPADREMPSAANDGGSGVAEVYRLARSLFAPILPALECFGMNFPWEIEADIAGTCPDDEAMRHLGIEALREAMRDAPVHHHTKDKRNIRLRDERIGSMARIVCDHLTTSGVAGKARLSGKMIYPPGGWMGWHTNSDQPGWRLYVNYVHEGGRSFFRWWDGAAIRSDHDDRGLNFRLFRVRAEPHPLWHCVYAGEWRLSMGYFLDEVAPFALQSALHAGAARPGDG